MNTCSRGQDSWPPLPGAGQPSDLSAWPGPWAPLMQACMRLSKCASMYVVVYAPTLMHASMHLCMHACMRVCMYACMHVWMNLCIYASMHLCNYSSKHLCIDASMHLCIY